MTIANNTEIARHAVKVAGTLSPSMEAEILEATERDGNLRIPGRHRMSTEGALSRRGMIEPGTTIVSNLGRLVRVVLLKGADEVLAWAARKDAERATDVARRLSSAMRGAVLSASDNRTSSTGQISPATNGSTLDALIARGIIHEERSHYFPRYFLTEFGSIVHAALTTNEGSSSDPFGGGRAWPPTDGRNR